MYRGKGSGVMGVPQLRQVTGRIEKAIAHIKNVTAQGMLAAMEDVHKQADDIVAVDTGALRASWFNVSNYNVGAGEGEVFKGLSASKSGDRVGRARVAMVKTNHSQVVAQAKADARSDPMKITVIAGYSAPYALYVHEMNRGWKGGLHVNWTKAGTENQWLEKAFTDNTLQILKTIRKYAKL